VAASSPSDIDGGLDDGGCDDEEKDEDEDEDEKKKQEKTKKEKKKNEKNKSEKKKKIEVEAEMEDDDDGDKKRKKRGKKRLNTVDTRDARHQIFVCTNLVSKFADESICNLSHIYRCSAGNILDKNIFKIKSLPIYSINSG